MDDALFEARFGQFVLCERTWTHDASLFKGSAALAFTHNSWFAIADQWRDSEPTLLLVPLMSTPAKGIGMPVTRAKAIAIGCQLDSIVPHCVSHHRGPLTLFTQTLKPTPVVLPLVFESLVVHETVAQMVETHPLHVNTCIANPSTGSLAVDSAMKRVHSVVLRASQPTHFAFGQWSLTEHWQLADPAASIRSQRMLHEGLSQDAYHLAHAMNHTIERSAPWPETLTRPPLEPPDWVDPHPATQMAWRAYAHQFHARHPLEAEAQRHEVECKAPFREWLHAFRSAYEHMDWLGQQNDYIVANQLMPWLEQVRLMRFRAYLLKCLPTV